MSHQIADYIIHFLARKEPPEDVQKLKEWLAADPVHRDELKQWLAAWDVAGMMGIAGKITPEEAYHRFIFRLNGDRETEPKAVQVYKTVQVTKAKPHLDTLIRTIRWVAAAVFAGFVLGMWTNYYLNENQQKQVAFVENIIPVGSKSEIKLPDGSTVWLNAGSKLRYPTNYGKTTRDIYLVGEGYFKVAKQVKKPFTVHTALSNITALGTEFNVKAYPEENVVETTLIKGEVIVEKNVEKVEESNPVVLKPGQKMLVYAHTEDMMYEPEEAKPDTQPVETDTPSTELQPEQPNPFLSDLSADIIKAEVSWKERNWHIESEPLQSLSIKMERRYNVTIHVDDRLKNYHFTGTINDETLEQVLHAMQLTSPILYKVEGKMVYLRVDPKKMK